MRLPNGIGAGNGITISMVGAALGTTATDLGKLCTNPNIAMWSKWKPISCPKLEGITEQDLHDAHYGLEWPTPILMGSSSGNSYFTKTTMPKMMKPDAKWKYNGPTGGPTSPYRLGDWRNYLTNAYPPVGSTYSRTWDDKPRTLEYSVTPEMAYVNLTFETPDSRDSHDLTYNLTFDDFTFMVANEGQQSTELNMDGTRLMIAVFSGHIDPFKTLISGSNFPVPVAWIIHDTPIKQDEGLKFHLKASALTAANSFDIDTTQIGQLTLVFMLGVGYEAHITNSSPLFRLYDHSTYNNGTAPYAPPYCMALPFDNQHYPVVWLDAFVNDNLRPVYFIVEPEEDTVWWKRYATTGNEIYFRTDHTTQSGGPGGIYNAKPIGPEKMWIATYEGEGLAVYNGIRRTNNTSDNVFISILLYNKSSNDFTLNINNITITSSHPNVTGTLDKYTADHISSWTIPAKGSYRIYLRVVGVYLTTNSGEPNSNTLTFTYNGGSQPNYTLGKITFVATTDERYNVTNN